MPITKTFVLTALLLKRIRTVRVQKGGCKFRIQSIYWNKPRWKNYKNSRCCRALGNPVQFLLTAGQIHDAKVAIELLSRVKITGSNILADKAYGSEQIRGYITAQGAVYTIPPKSNLVDPWFCDFCTYKERHVVECFFNKMKSFRRVATRYDKLASSFFAFVLLAAIWLLAK